MNPCPQCGAIPQASDKFCNICGTPVGPPAFGAPNPGAPAAQGGFPPPQQGFGAPPQGAYGAPPGQAPALRCQMGHDIAPGASYCAHGHPLALEAMPFANDQYGGGGGYGQQPPGFGAPPPPPGYGGPPYGQAPYNNSNDPNAPYGGYGAQQPGGFGAQSPQPHYGGQPGFGNDPGAYGGQPGFGAPQPGVYPAPGGQQGGFGAPPPQQGGFGGQQGGFGAPPPPLPGYGAPPPQGDVAGAPAAAPINVPANGLRGFLVSYQSNTSGDFWPLHGGRKTVGRANSGEQVDIPLSDATISSRHAALVVDASVGTLHVEDTGSTNGTFVNEEHIGFNGKRELRDGDKIRFGGYTTLVKVIGRL